ncbi:MAG TPA: SH3 domain-containing protein [Spirochaetia bacterium]|nr:SH3 domain-containing protein [Spirochaetia bacterium]
MRNIRLPLRVIVILFLLIGLYAAAQEMMSVTVKETQVRSTPSFMGKILANLAYGDRVQIVEKAKSWAKVLIPGGKGDGWVSLSALTEKRVVLKAGSQDVDKTASSGEVALAGKGFNADVEAKYKKDKNLDYTWIDRMEQFKIPPDQLVSFLTAGGLKPAEGGAK